MRHISFRDQGPCATWLTKANMLLDKLKAAPDEEARNKIIDDNTTTLLPRGQTEL